MAAQTYGYEAHFKWKWHKAVDIWAIQNDEDVKTQLRKDFENVFLAEFAEKLAAAGHWFRMDRVETMIQSFSAGYTFGFPVPGYGYDAGGETVIYFETEIKDASAHSSPQLWDLVKTAIENVVEWIGLHPGIVVVLLVIGVLTILAVWLINTITGALNTIGGNPFSSAIALAAIGFGALIVLVVFMGRGKKKRSGTRKRS